MWVARFIGARLYGRSENGGSVSRPAIIVASVGVAVGVAVMLISVGVALGFKEEVRSIATAMHGDIQLVNYRSLTSQESFPLLVDDTVLAVVNNSPEIVRCERFVSKSGVLKSKEAFHGIVLVGTEDSDSLFSVSHKLARILSINQGDKINTYFFERTIRARRFVIDTLYSTGMEQTDSRIMKAGYDVVHGLTGWGRDECSGLRIFTNGKRDSKEIAYDISRQLAPYSLEREICVLTADELSPQVFAWLSLLDTNVWIILSLMLCVATFTMVSGLLILILERTSAIALLKSMGATDGLVRGVFVQLASMILLRAMACGIVVGLGLMWLQRVFGVVRLDPSEYYIDTVPVVFHWPYFAAVCVGTFFVSVLTLLLPALFVSRICPASVMRIE